MIAARQHLCLIMGSSVLHTCFLDLKPPGMFQRVMEVWITTLKGQLTLLYLNNIEIVLQNAKWNYWPRLTSPDVTTRQNSAVLTLSLKIYELFVNSIAFLIHSILPESLQVSECTISTTRRFLHPIRVTEVQYFSGLCSIFRRLVPNLAGIAPWMNRRLLEGQSQTFHRFSTTNYPRRSCWRRQW